LRFSASQIDSRVFSVAQTLVYADHPGGMWCLSEGALSVEMAPGVRDPQMSYLLLPPVWVGEGGIIVDAPRSVGLSTTRRSVLLHLPSQRFFDIAKDEPTIWRWVAKVQKLNFERSLRMTDALMVRSSEARVSAVLLQLGGRLGAQADTPRVLDITQAQLAAIANLSRSVLSPVLQTLASRGAIELGHRTITVTDPAALRRPR
jgi:CRP-like cAMP-binding protein